MNNTIYSFTIAPGPGIINTPFRDCIFEHFTITRTLIPIRGTNLIFFIFFRGHEIFPEKFPKSFFPGKIPTLFLTFLSDKSFCQLFKKQKRKRRSKNVVLLWLYGVFYGGTKIAFSKIIRKSRFFKNFRDWNFREVS